MIVFGFNKIEKVKKSLKILEGLTNFLPEGVYLLGDKGRGKIGLANKNGVYLEYSVGQGALTPEISSIYNIHDIGDVVYKFLYDLDVNVPLDAVMFSLPINYSDIRIEEIKFGVYWLLAK